MKEKKSFIIFCICFIIVFVIKYAITGSGIPCPIYLITGLSCPGCGITRMCLSLLKLDFYQAFRYNPLIFSLLIVTLIYKIINIIIKKIFNKELVIQNWVYIVLLIVVISFGILRNISYFSFLLPTQVN